MMLCSSVVDLIKLLEIKDLHVHEIDHQDISYLNFPLALIHNAEVYIMHQDNVVYLGSKRGVYTFAKHFDLANYIK